MFYPSTTIDDLMPDVLLESAYNGLEKTAKDCITYITKSSAKLGRMVMETTKISEVCKSENIQPQHINEGTRGVVPQNVSLHPIVGYSYRYGSITLNGLDNDMEQSTVNNGSWRP